MHVFNNSSQDEETMLAEQDCIYAVSGVSIDFFEIRPRLLERLRSCVAFMRSNILRTLESLVDKREAFGEDQVGRLLQYCGQAMTFIASAVEGCGPGHEEDHLWTDIQAFTVAARIWLEEWSPEGNTFAVKFLCICITSHDPQTVTVVDDGINKRRALLDVAVSRLNFSADDIICLALARLRRSNYDDLTFHLIMVLFLIEGTDIEAESHEGQNFQLAFERHRGASVLLRCLDKILKKCDFDLDAPNSSHIDTENLKAISYCLESSARILVGARTLSPLKQALNRDLIRLFACCSTQQIHSKLTADNKAVISTILLQTARNSFVVRHIVQAAQRTVAKYQHTMGRDDSDEYTLSEVFPSLMTSDIKDVWEKFFLLLNHQSSSFRLIARERREEMHACGNPSCDIQGTKSELFRCAGCYITLFCTRKCQAIAWRDNEHKANCARYQNVHAGISHVDADFIIRYGYENARRLLCAAVTHSLLLKIPEVLGLAVSLVDGIDPRFSSFEVAGDDLATYACIAQYYPLRGSGLNSAVRVGEPEPEVQILLKIMYGLGRIGRTIHIRTSMSRAACEGRECSCCRFHAGDDSRTKGCEEIGSTSTSDRVKCCVHSGV